MSDSSRNNDQFPTNRKTILLGALTCVALVTHLTPDQAHVLVELLPVAVPLLSDRRR